LAKHLGGVSAPSVAGHDVVADMAAFALKGRVRRWRMMTVPM
jgi:hypothetical protein